MKTTIALGLMCGTSVDAIDVAWLKTDGENVLEFGASLAFPVPQTAREIIKASMQDAKTVAHRDERTLQMRQAEDLVDSLHIAAIEAFAVQYPKEYQQVELIGYHGQTVFHAPERGITIQLGRGERLAQHFYKQVVFDFIAADVAAGGQGAPLVPIFHTAVAAHAKLPSPCVFVNIGGVANVTFVCHPDPALDAGEGSKDSSAMPQNDNLLAFDCGAGNALIDDAMQKYFGLGYDDGGKTALSGQVDCAILKQLLSHEFFDVKPPKSLDRNSFYSAIPSFYPLWVVSTLNSEKLKMDPPHKGEDEGGGGLQNIITTLTEFTVQGIVQAAKYFPQPPKLWVIAGGGVHNTYMMQRLNEMLPASVKPASELNISEEFLEAQAFAYLAVRSVKQLPLTFPSTTKVPAPMCGGVSVRPK